MNIFLYEYISIGDIGAGVGQLGAWLNASPNSKVRYHGWNTGENLEELDGQTVSLNNGVITVPHICYINVAVNILPYIPKVRFLTLKHQIVSKKTLNIVNLEI